jgi:hypothetical protein
MSIILDGLEFELANFVGSDGLGHVSTQPATTGASGASYPAEPLFPERVFRAALNQLGQGLFSTSTTSLAIGTGSKAFTLATSVQITDGAFILATDTANDANYMYGQVTSVVGLVYTVNVIATGGSGTISSWNFQVSGVQGVAGTVADGDKGDIVVSGGGGTWTLEDGAVTEAKMTLADNTTHNATTSAHGFLKKLSNVAGEFMNGVGNWAVPPQGLQFPRLSGRWYMQENIKQLSADSLTTPTLSANTLYAVPFFVHESETYDGLSITITTTAASNGRLGIYTDSGGYPDELVKDTGDFSTSNAASQPQTFTAETLAAGIYWLVFLTNASTLQVRGILAAACTDLLGREITSSPATFGNGNVITRIFSYAALPDPFTAGGSVSSEQAPIIQIRKA